MTSFWKEHPMIGAMSGVVMALVAVTLKVPAVAAVKSPLELMEPPVEAVQPNVGWADIVVANWSFAEAENC